MKLATEAFIAYIKRTLHVNTKKVYQAIEYSGEE